MSVIDSDHAKMHVFRDNLILLYIKMMKSSIKTKNQSTAEAPIRSSKKQSNLVHAAYS
jgi:hypothetical protein